MHLKMDVNKLIFLVVQIVLCVAQKERFLFGDSPDLPRKIRQEEEYYNIRAECKQNGENDLQLVNAVYELSVQFQKLIDKTVGVPANFIISPLCLSSMICELIFSTRGERQTQLIKLLWDTNLTNPHAHAIIHKQMQILFCELGMLNKNAEGSAIDFASAFFLHPDVELLDSYLANITQIYRTALLEADFRKDPVGAFNSINKWAFDKSGGRITQVLSNPLPTTTIGILMNALYFKDEWDIPFAAETTTIDQFQISPTEAVETPVMRGLHEILFTNNNEFNCKMIALPYKDGRNTMFLILPNDNSPYKFDVKSFAKQFYSMSIIKYLRKSLKSINVRIVIPKLNVHNSHSLVKAFQGGSENATRFYFNGVSPTQFYMDDLVQQVSLTINEKGTEAAAVTSSNILLSGASENFFATRPFIFFINNELTGVTLFWGTISNPTLG